MENNKQPTATDLCALAAQQISRKEYSQALHTYQQVTQQHPAHVPAYAGIARLLQMHGNYNHALQALSYALRIEPNNSIVRQQMIPLLATISPSSFSSDLEHDLLLCFDEPDIDYQQLARVAASLLWAKYHSTTITAGLLDILNGDALLLCYLSRCINTHAQLEQWLTHIRKMLLLTAELQQEATLHSDLTCALALTCFANEYIFEVSAEESQAVHRLEHQLEEYQKEEHQRVNASDTKNFLALLGLYKPLFKLSQQHITAATANEIVRDNKSLWSLLVKRSLLDLQEENVLKETFAIIKSDRSNNPAQNLSAQVQSQYEENPYPRWQTPPAPTPVAIIDMLQCLPAVNRAILPKDTIDILVAGCGTGFEPIDLARTDNSTRITALDLSSSSLAYAKRMANTLAINNIHFVQGNILDAHKLDKTFDLINSTGVLHHMENPLAGWQVLRDIVKPGGIMRISLYSELARKRVALAHQRIKELGLGSTAEDIKKFRNNIFQQPQQSPLGELTLSDDFYSISGCRDLLFHVKEHRFTLPQLKTIINDLQLTLVGFDVPPQAQHTFQQRYPNPMDLLDLDKWHEFESAFPDTFVGMYQLWLQKEK
ncbi:class I SAM-dependent methyltransferase [Cellvibrio sp. UBA7661]|uniref:class I SAM-dependent methyltransferase n=1 Tax=Cellvibrio sp. UBA7661 TaxID=1946311 RepID=UPI002F357115